MRRAALIAAAAVAALGFTVGADAAKPKAPLAAPRIAEATSGADFPSRALVLSLPTRTRLTAAKLTVRENGKPVNDLQLLAPGGGGAGGTIGTVLLIDASQSMAGKPIENAMQAARTFASRRNPGQQLAVITFNDSTHVLLPFTSDGALIGKALAKTPALAVSTHMYDAIATAVQEIRNSSVTVGSIVLLSDGKDIGSTTTADKAAADAADAKARIFSVGLESKQFDPATLAAISSKTGGTSSVASNASELGKIYSALGYALSNEYLVRYRSLAGPSKKINVAVHVAGFPGTAVMDYTTPSIAARSIAPYQRSSWDRFIQNDSTAVIVVLAFVVLVGLAVFFALRRRDRRFQRRMGQFVSLPIEEQARERRAQVATYLQRERKRFTFQDYAWYSKLEQDMELARIDMKPSAVVGLSIVLGLVIGIIVAAATGTVFGLLAGLVAIFFPRPFVAFKLRRIRKEFAEQLPENLDVLASALRTGHSFVGAMSVAILDAGEPSQSEFRRAVADEQLGVPIEEALRVVSQRMENRDLIQVALVAALQRDAGTNAAEVLDQVAENVRNRMELLRLIRTLTAQGRMARWIVSVLPVFLFLAIYLINPDYLQPLWTHAIGVVAMIVAGFMIVLGSFIIKRIISIEV